MSKIPKLRFKEFSGEWEEKQLSDFINIISGYAFKSDFFVENGKKLVIPKNFTKYGYGNFSNSISKYTSEACDSKYLCKEGNLLVLLTDLTPSCELLGKPLLMRLEDGEVLLNQRIAKIETNQSLDKIFLSNLFLTDKYHERIVGTATGSTVRHSSNKIILETIFPIPTILEQQKIASFLFDVNTKIYQLNRKKEHLEQYKKGLMQKIFSQELRFKADDGSEYPEWEQMTLGEIFIEVTEKVGKQKIETFSISAGKGFISQKEKFGKDISGDQNEKYIVLQPNEFSYNKGNSKTYQYGCIYPNLMSKKIAVPNVFISFKLKNPHMDIIFFAKLFEMHFLDKGLREIISSSARTNGLLNVNKSDFFNLTIPCPENEEQTKIANFLSAIDTKVDLVTKQLDEAKNFKKGLLQQMFI